MGLAIDGREITLLSFLTSLESISNKENQFVDERGMDQEEDHCLMGTCVEVISWNVRGAQ